MDVPATDSAHADQPGGNQLNNDQLIRRLAGLERLLNVTRTLAVEIDLNKILDTIVTQACKALDCDRATLYRYDAQHDQLYTKAVTELEIEEIRNGLETGISGYVARSRTVANVADPSQDARWNSTVDQATGYRTKNVLAAPLTSPRDDGLLGVISALNKNQGSFDESDERLIEAFGQHAAVALDRARLVDNLTRRQEVELSLQAARCVQRGFMPDETPRIPLYESATWWYPQEAVGGDYCDVHRLHDGRIALCVADVCGHGLGPSLMMASVRAALRALLLEHDSPDQLLQLLARSLADDFRKGTFITMVLAILDPLRHRIEFANAGHEPAMHYCAASGEFTTLRATGMPLGVKENVEYPLGDSITMQVGDMIVLCTDGIVEAIDAAGQQFGQQRLRQVVRSLAEAPIDQLVDGIGREVSEFYEGHSPADDLTVLALRRNG